MNGHNTKEKKNNKVGGDFVLTPDPHEECKEHR